MKWINLPITDEQYWKMRKMKGYDTWKVFFLKPYLKEVIKDVKTEPDYSGFQVQKDNGDMQEERPEGTDEDVEGSGRG